MQAVGYLLTTDRMDGIGEDIIAHHYLIDKRTTSICAKTCIALYFHMHIPLTRLSSSRFISLPLYLFTNRQARYLKGKSWGLLLAMSQGFSPKVNSRPLYPDFLGPTCLDKALIDIETLWF